MQKCESRTKRVMSAIIAGMMALQVVAPTISYADDTVASTVSSEDNSDTQIDPGVPVQTDTASSNTVTEPDSSESLEETADSEQTGEIQDDTVSDSQGNETNTQKETVQDTVQQNNSGSETTESESVRTVTVTLNKNGGIFEPEWLETANEDPIAAYLGTETNDIAIEDTGDTIVATVTDRDSISIPVALSGDDSLYFTTHVPVAPPKEEPKQEETATPAAPAPVVEIKTEPTTTVIETPNKQTGISFMDGLFG